MPERGGCSSRNNYSAPGEVTLSKSCTGSIAWIWDLLSRHLTLKNMMLRLNKQTNNFLMSTVHYDLLHSNLKFSFRRQDWPFIVFILHVITLRTHTPGNTLLSRQWGWISACRYATMLRCIAPWKQIKMQPSYKNIKYFNVAGPHRVGAFFS